MTLFVVVAALMAALAASAVAVPLWRHRQSRTVGAAAALLIVAAAAALYPLWSNWHWHDSAQNPSECYQVVAVQDDINISNMHLLEGKQPTSEFLPVTNPHDDQDQLAIPYILANAGQSHWASLYRANGGWQVLDSM